MASATSDACPVLASMPRAPSAPIGRKSTILYLTISSCIFVRDPSTRSSCLRRVLSMVAMAFVTRSFSRLLRRSA